MLFFRSNHYLINFNYVSVSVTKMLWNSFVTCLYGVGIEEYQLMLHNCLSSY